MKIVVVGLGYVGISNAVLLAQHNEVIGVDISEDRVSALNAGISPIIDARISEFLANKKLNLSASTDLAASVCNANYVIVSTPTNYDEEKNFFDTSSVEEVIQKVIRHEKDTCVVVKSTIPVGFIDDISKRLNTSSVIFSPEFLREGHALHDNLYPSRIIVGEKSKRASQFAKLLLQGTVKKDVDIILTGSREAEAIKLFSNSYLAMRVAFFNELDNFALAFDMDSKEIIQGVSLDPRVGNHYNNPSFGYGGYCLPKDTKQLLASYQSVPQKIIQAIVEANATRKDFLVKQLIAKQPNTVGIYKLEMKAGSDNFRQSSVIDIIKSLCREGIEVIIYEPMLNTDWFLGSKVKKDLNEFKRLADIVVANRFTDDLTDVVEKLFTRDVFNEN
ncbi:nucleotide sugar dehydrogenase [Planktomarina temperata]|nr:nucleotide sugar dehydrogenase [Planktomarina temperata]MDB2460767.1 nucleotide sugar dehydrogenase [Planktomarina temperata]